MSDSVTASQSMGLGRFALTLSAAFLFAWRSTNWSSSATHASSCASDGAARFRGLGLELELELE
jgi:hypothetical protein